MITARHVATAAAALALSIFPAAAQESEAAKASTAAEAATPTGQPAEASIEASAEVEAGRVTEASPADFREGLEVRDAEGGMVGTIESVDNEGAVVNTGSRRAKLPFRSFGKNNVGLVISLSRSELEAAAAAQTSG